MTDERILELAQIAGLTSQEGVYTAASFNLRLSIIAFARSLLKEEARNVTQK